MAYVLQHLAAIGALEEQADRAQARSHRERAAMLLGFVEVRLTALEVRREHTEQQEYDRVVAALREELGERLEAVMALGADWSEERGRLRSSLHVVLRRERWERASRRAVAIASRGSVAALGMSAISSKTQQAKLGGAA